jgi:hypothetical protein
MRVVGVSYKVGTTEMRVMVQDAEKRQILDLRVRWYSVNDLPPNVWHEMALCEASQVKAADPFAQMMSKFGG